MKYSIMILLQRMERRGEKEVNKHWIIMNESVRVNNGKSLSKNNYYNPVNY